ncbi:permease [Mangrovivirga sp. M17]|uniref:Permease n=1 Tax=Mangrovivirga halotolerans TaxID=2993936 RepID=A0ABT3RV52_9BACT|nr:permease [Mangrovivirga halotolerans]MCX2745401.1 permease [Mangrovivirga halotolerans]
MKKNTIAFLVLIIIPTTILAQDSNQSFTSLWGESAKTALGFFWKSGWAFVLGYMISGAIQAFVPKKKLTRHMGKGDAKSVSLSTAFGAISSSCSFAALAAARSLFLKGAHFISTVAFMFASTNLVIELGILIFIFLGWQFIVAEVIGGLLLIIISSIIIKLTYPKKWIEAARERVEEESEEEEDFDWRERIKSKEGWFLVGKKFVMEWKMAWEDILIGFTIAGFVSVLVPQSFWEAIFLNNMQEELPEFVIRVENALVAPFVAAATFIGSMGNIPLATVLNENGILFAGLMGFIYSDLMVPPLVNINRKYYGVKVAFYIAGVMYVSIVLTALILNYSFDLLNVLPEGSRKVKEVTQFKIDYTFYFNIVFAAFTVLMLYFNSKASNKSHGHDHDHNGGGISFKRIVVYVFAAIVLIGLIIHFV